MPTARNGRNRDPRRHAGRVHHDQFGIVAELVEHVGDRDHQRDRRDDQQQQRNDQTGDADEDEDALALIGHQVDVAQRLRDPHQRGHAGANHQERTERGAKDITPDRPHTPYASPLAANPSQRLTSRLDRMRRAPRARSCAPMVNRPLF